MSGVEGTTASLTRPAEPAREPSTQVSASRRSQAGSWARASLTATDRQLAAPSSGHACLLHSWAALRSRGAIGPMAGLD